MKKFLFLLLFFKTCSFAEGPLFRHREPEKQQEFENVYQDIRHLASTSGGGASSLSVNKNGLQVSSPTAQINFSGDYWGVGLGGTSTATITLNGGNTNYIQNTGTLQSGSSFYVFSGTTTTLGATIINQPFSGANYFPYKLDNSLLSSSYLGITPLRIVSNNQDIATFFYSQNVSESDFSSVFGKYYIMASTSPPPTTLADITGVKKSFIVLDPGAEAGTSAAVLPTAQIGIGGPIANYVEVGENYFLVSRSSFIISGSTIGINGTTYKWNAGTGVSGQFLTTDGAAQPTLTWATGGGGGASSLSVNKNGVQVSSPTSQINFIGPPFTVTLGGASTSTVSLDGSSVTLRGNIFNTGSNLLQLTSGLVPNANIDGSSITKQGVLTAGSNITLTPTAGVLTISAGSSGGGYSLEPATVTIQANKGITLSTGVVSSTFTFNNSSILSMSSASIMQIPHSSTATPTCTDALRGMVYVDTNSANGQQFIVCEGTSGWVIQGKDVLIDGTFTTVSNTGLSHQVNLANRITLYDFDNSGPTANLYPLAMYSQPAGTDPIYPLLQSWTMATGADTERYAYAYTGLKRDNLGQDSYWSIWGSTVTPLGGGSFYQNPFNLTRPVLTANTNSFSTRFGNIGINVSTPSATLSVGGHIQIATNTATTPVVSACGTSPSVSGYDGQGAITVGTGGIATSCTLTFGTAWTNAPTCSVSHEGAILFVRSVTTTTTLVIDAVSPLTASGSIKYMCVGRE